MTRSSADIKYLAYDIALFFPVFLLVGIGIVMVYSASSTLALQRFGSDYFFLKKQIMFAAAGLVVLMICRHLPYHWYRNIAYPLVFTAIALLIILLTTGYGYSAGGSTRWLRIKSFNFQPSEVARFALIIYLAYSMSKKHEKIKEFSIGFLPHVLVFTVLAVLIFLQPDFGSVVILGTITWVMMFIGGVRMMHLMTGLLVFVPSILVMLYAAPYRIRRLLSFMDPWQYPSDEGYQIIHSLMAFGTGGIWGTGIGKGYQKLFYLPEPHTDFIFSVIGEELGLIGVLAILLLYLIILWRGVIIARNTDDLFGQYMAVGLVTALGLQVCINMGVTLGLLPTKGLTLPFLSYGGTSLLLNMAAIGILMNIGAKRF
ncbi:MAG: putative lipid II flippase FtsW [Desulfobacterales bacterium]|nr:putative lipid II flippase FtsW [Desulfobacterales bacterium]